MDNLYNPDLMPEEEIKETFVARQPLVDKLVALIQSQPEGAGVQHAVLVAPRGMGKTTTLLMVKFAIKDQRLDPPWLAVRFPEEMYGVNDLADFWLEVANQVAREASDGELAAAADRLRDTYARAEDLENALLALLRDWCRKQRRRLVLLVDNIGLLLQQIDSERENASLRRVLMNEGFFAIIGAAPTFFKEASGYDQPLYNFFKIEHLRPLTYDEMEDLLAKRARADGRLDLAEKITANRGRMRALEYFTGGNTRLILMLYGVVAEAGLLEARQGLQRLLDQVTPYYKAKTEALPAQQRKVIDTLARLVGSRDGVTPTEIAKHSRLTSQVVSAQLKRLLEDGYVQVANVRGRRSFYMLSEPLYSLWHQMRFGRDIRQRMEWLVSFLKSWYDPQEISVELGRWQDRFKESIASGNKKVAREALEYRRWFAEAAEPSIRDAALRDLLRDCIDWNDPGVFKELGFSAESAADLLYRDNELFDLSHFEEVLAKYKHSLESAPPNAIALFVLGIAQISLSRYEEALTSFNRGLELTSTNADIWFLRGIAQISLSRYEEALTSFDRGLELVSTNADIWFLRGTIQVKISHYEEAIASFDHSLELVPTNADIWLNRGFALNHLFRSEEAINSYWQSLRLIEPDKRWLPLISIIHTSIFANNDDEAISAWLEFVQTNNTSPEAQEAFSDMLTLLIKHKRYHLLRKMFVVPEAQERFFPLVRALEFHDTRNQDLIEKLAPEIRPIVEEVVAKLDAIDSETESASKG